MVLPSELNDYKAHYTHFIRLNLVSMTHRAMNYLYTVYIKELLSTELEIGPNRLSELLKLPDSDFMELLSSASDVDGKMLTAVEMSQLEDANNPHFSLEHVWGNLSASLAIACSCERITSSTEAFSPYFPSRNPSISSTGSWVCKNRWSPAKDKKSLNFTILQVKTYKLSVRQCKMTLGSRIFGLPKKSQHTLYM